MAGSNAFIGVMVIFGVLPDVVLRRLRRLGRADGSFTTFLVRNTAGTLAVRVGAVTVNYSLMVFLARSLGAEGYGSYVYALSWLAVLMPLCGLGLRNVIIRHTIMYRSTGDWDKFWGLIAFSYVSRISASIVVVGCGFVTVAIVADGDGPGNLVSQPIPLVLLLLPLMGFLGILTAIQEGFQQVLRAQLSDAILRPCILSVLLFVTVVLSVFQSDVAFIVVLNLAATAVVLLCTGALVGATLHGTMPDYHVVLRPKFEIRSWIAPAFFLMAYDLLSNLSANLATLMLGWFADLGTIGQYQIAFRNAHLVGVLVAVVATPLGPRVAQAHAQGNMGEAEVTIRHAYRVLLLVSFVLLCGVVALGQRYLGLFGIEFAEAYSSLLILCSGVIMRIALGPAQLVLVMSGREKDATVCLLLAFLVGVALNLVLIPQYGADGAAVATTVAGLVESSLAVYVAVSVLGFNPTIWAGMSRRERLT